MRFDISKLDLKLLLRALILNSEPNGIGIAEYLIKKDRNLLVDSITDKEFEFYTYDLRNAKEGNFRILDYYYGKPIKFDIRKKANGQILVDSSAFDSRIGKYKFLEILISYFQTKDFTIIKKGYTYNNFPETDLNRKEDIKELKKITNNLLVKRNVNGRHWIVDDSKIQFESEYNQIIK
ncbi:hypothetical protein [Epilithonimonas mollis]|uniref:Uncharacterized protein n=1 Tax=Epilithonimonas mollis TaxID=216903 RepID=A0A1M6UIL5_9FLAO|nr:hypothetical protein [Epilithonimonas mollis]SHK69019.1 hypothetical protein SAMN05444371_3309 [Epilithonimonas mollis]